MRLNEVDTAAILDLLRTFTYTTEVDGEEVTVNAILWDTSLTSYINKFFLQKKGRLRADSILEEYSAGDVSAQYVAACLKILLVPQWKHFLEMWKSQYNPLWNVDGVETRTITTDYGKITTTEFDSTLTDEQTVDGKNNLTHGLKVDITEPTTTGKVAAYDQSVYVGAAQNEATAHYSQNSGTDSTALSMGTIEHAKDGEDTVSNSGQDKVKDVYERHGNIGVTMTQQLLTAEKEFWEKFNFFDMFFSSIADELTIPIYD